MTKFRIVRWGDYPGLFHRVHSDQKDLHEGKRSQENQRYDKEIRGLMWPGAKESRQPLLLAEAKKGILSLEPPESDTP